VPENRLALFLIAALLLAPLHRHQKPIGDSWVPEANDRVRILDDALTRAYASLDPNTRILFVADPFEKGDWILTSIIRLHYRDKSIVVDRVKDKPDLAEPVRWPDYKHVFRLESGGLVEVSRVP
jgi:hypothetical protein